MRTPAFSLGAFLLLLGLGMAFRLTGLTWGTDAHRMQDEEDFLLTRKLLQPPRTLGEYFDFRSSSANPYLDGFDLTFPVYGSLPSLLSTTLVSVPEPADSPAARFRARVLSAMSDVVVLLLVGFVGFRSFSPQTGLLALALYSLFPIAITSAHIATSSWAALVPNVLLLGIILPSRETRDIPAPLVAFIGLGLIFGAAVALDPRNALLAACLPFLFLVRGATSSQSGSELTEADPNRHPLSFTVVSTCMSLLSAWLAFRILQPYAFEERAVISFQPRFLEAGAKILFAEHSAVPALQSVRLESTAQMMRIVEFGFWAFGPLSFLVLAVILLGGMLPRALSGGDFRSIALGSVVFSYFALLGFQQHPDPSALIFAAPAAALLIADFLVELSQPPVTVGKGIGNASGASFFPAFVALLVGAGLLGAMATNSLFTQTSPLDPASRWLAENVDRGATLLVEREDVRLPGPLNGKIPGPFRFSEVAPMSADFHLEDRYLLEQLTRADAVILSSSAGLEAARLARSPSLAFYEELFGGRSGFEVAAYFACETRVLRWEVARRWIPLEVRYPLCPDVTIFLPRKG